MNQRTGLHLTIAAAALLLSAFSFNACLDNPLAPEDVLLLQHAQQATTASSALWPPWGTSWHRPLAQAFLWCEYQLFGMESWLYLFTQLLLHVCNATLVFSLFRYPTGAPVAATAAFLFALGFGFYGTTLLRLTGLAELLALFFVLAAGIAAARSQLLRTAQQRSLSMLMAAIFFLGGLLCHESAAMALVVIGALMWPNRRSVFSVIRKLAMLVLLLFLWIVYQWQQASDPSVFSVSLRTLLAMPWHALQMATFMFVPLQAGIVATDPTAWFTRLISLLDQTRPVYSLVVAGGLAWWFWRGPGAVRWLIASCFACLLPIGLLATDSNSLPVQHAYLAAPFFCGLLAHGLRSMWLQTDGVGRIVAAAILSCGLALGLLLIRGIEQEHHARAAQSAAQAALDDSPGGMRKNAKADRGSTDASEPVGQKSVPMATLEPLVMRWKSGS